MEAVIADIKTDEFEFDPKAFNPVIRKEEKKEAFNPYKVGLSIGMR